MASVGSALFEFGVAARSCSEQSPSGDMQVVQQFPGGFLVAVIDGIGHGEPAAEAAGAAAGIIREQAQQPVLAIVESAHEALKQSRGAVMSLASFDARNGMMCWLGIGNVFGMLARRYDAATEETPEVLLLRPGVVGAQLPAMQAAVLAVAQGDTLVFATDGVVPGFEATAVRDMAPQPAAERILERHGKQTDDAMVVVVRYLGK